MMSVSNQMMKGLLDGAILGLIAKGETYGYEILENCMPINFLKLVMEVFILYSYV